MATGWILLSLRVLFFLVNAVVLAVFHMRVTNHPKRNTVPRPVQITFYILGTSVLLACFCAILVVSNPFLSMLSSQWNLNLNVICRIFGLVLWTAVVVSKNSLAVFYVHRIELAFRNTIFRLSTTAKIGTVLCYVVGTICVTTGVLAFAYGPPQNIFVAHPKLGTCHILFARKDGRRRLFSLFLAWVVLDVSGQLFLTAVFSYKLFLTQQLVYDSDVTDGTKITIGSEADLQKEEEAMTNLIGRTTVLMGFSATVSLVAFGIFYFLSVVLTEVDISVNFVSAVLMLGIFENEYRYACCCFARCCDYSCSRCVEIYAENGRSRVLSDTDISVKL